MQRITEKLSVAGPIVYGFLRLPSRRHGRRECLTRALTEYCYRHELPFRPAGPAVAAPASTGPVLPVEELPPSDTDVLRRLRSMCGPAGWAFLHTAQWWVALRGKTETVTARDPIRLRFELETPPVRSLSLQEVSGA